MQEKRVVTRGKRLHRAVDGSSNASPIVSHCPEKNKWSGTPSSLIEEDSSQPDVP